MEKEPLPELPVLPIWNARRLNAQFWPGDDPKGVGEFVLRTKLKPPFKDHRLLRGRHYYETIVVVTDVCVIRKLIPKQGMSNMRVHRKYLVKAHELHKRIPAIKPRVTDVLGNLEINSQITNQGPKKNPKAKESREQHQRNF